MPLAPRRSSSPIRKPSRATTFFSNITRAATYPSIHHPFPISPNSCFTDDDALEQLLSHSLPNRPSSPSPAEPIPLSPAASDVTHFQFLLPDPVQPVDSTDTMSNNSHQPSASPSGSNNNSNNNRRSNSNPTPSRSSTRGRRSSNTSNRESNGRRRNAAPNASLQCPICHQFYSRRDNLRAHQRVHTGDRPYQCRFCAQRFRWLGALRNHESNHERDGDHPLNPPPPGARQPTASSSRQSNASSASQASSSASTARSADRSTDRSTDRHRTRSQQPTSSIRAHAGQASNSSHRSQRSAPAQPRRHPHVPNLELEVEATHDAPNRHVFFTDDEPQVSPLYTGTQDGWGDILDDIPENRSRD